MNIGLVDSELNFNFRLFCKTVSKSANWGFDRLRLYYPKWHTKIQVRRPDGSILDTQQFTSDNGFEHDFSFDLSENINNEEYSVYICGVTADSTYMQAYAYPSGYSATYGRNAQITYWDFNIISPEFVSNVHGSLFFENQPLTKVDGALNIKAKTIRFQNSQLGAEDLADILIGIDNNGVTGGSINYSGNLAAPAERALTAYNNLKDNKGWALTGEVPRDSASYEAKTTAYMTELGIPDDENPSIYGITNNAVWGVVNDFVLELKNEQILSKAHRIFAKLGNSASQKAVDLIDPSRSGTFSGSWVLDENGAKSNGTNAYFNTGFNPFNFDANNIGFTISPLAVVSTGVYGVLVGAYTSSARFEIYNRLAGDDNLVSYLGGLGKATGNPLQIKPITNTRDISTTYFYENGVYFDGDANSGIMPNLNVYEGCSNFEGTPSRYSSATIGVSVYHEHLTSSEVTILKNAIITLETALNMR